MRRKITISIDDELLAALDQHAQELRESRSFALRNLLRHYFGVRNGRDVAGVVAQEDVAPAAATPHDAQQLR